MSINRNSFLLAHTVGKIKTGQVQKNIFLACYLSIVNFCIEIFVGNNGEKYFISRSNEYKHLNILKLKIIRFTICVIKILNNVIFHYVNLFQ